MSVSVSRHPPTALPGRVRARASEPRDSLAYTRIKAALANWMLTGARCGHHAKVTLDPFQRVSEEAAPPQDPHGAQNARRLATPKATEQLAFTGLFGDSRCQNDEREFGISANGSVYAGSSRR